MVPRRVHALDEELLAGLCDVLVDCVEGGASVSFVLPLTRERAAAFWRRVARGVAAGERALLVAEDEQGICGTVQLVLEQPENQPHRAEVSKMLVHRRARRRGLGAALMRAAEALARESGKTLLVLDTASAEARRLYERMGWVRVGVIPDFALLPQGGLCATTVYYRDLSGASGELKGLNLNQVTLPTVDLERAVRFYRTLGLMQIVSSPPRYARFECPDGRATLSLHHVPSPPAQPGAVVYFECENLDERFQGLRERGVEFDSPPTDQPWLWREAHLRDPDGNRLCLFRAGDNRRFPPWRIEPDLP